MNVQSCGGGRKSQMRDKADLQREGFRGACGLLPVLAAGWRIPHERLVLEAGRCRHTSYGLGFLHTVRSFAQGPVGCRPTKPVL